MFHLHGLQNDDDVAGIDRVAGRDQPLDNLRLQGGAELVHHGIVRHDPQGGRQASDTGAPGGTSPANLLHNRGMPHTPLIEMTRGGTLENQHFGSVAVVNTRGQLRAFAGDPHWLTFTRSTLKAL